jgi:hypothetical protein
LTTPTAVARIILLHVLRSWHQVDKVEELAALLRASRCGFALDHAHQANLGHASAHHVERLHQAAKPVALHLESSTHGFRLGAGAQINRHHWLGRRFGLACTDASVAFSAGFGAGFAGSCLVAWRGSVRRSL